MKVMPTQRRFASLAAFNSLPQFPLPRGESLRFCRHDISRRHFLGAAAGAGLFLASSQLSPGLAASCADPRPIPQGNQFLFPDPTVFHIELPGFPGFPDNDPAANDPSVITDFNGHSGLAYVRGTGTHTDLTTGMVSNLPFEVDLRFMEGTYVGLDGGRHHGAFALI